MPVGDHTPFQSSWTPRQKDVKHYLHFDRRLPSIELARIANDPVMVARNPFYPLFLYEEKWTRFRGSGSGKRKSRPIRFSARRDAAIYARYRVLLSELYENELAALGIGAVPIAYRRIEGLHANKCNIEFARDVFDLVRGFGDWDVTVLDISSFFESLDHRLIREKWERLIGGPLPPDHLAVFKSITSYATVSLEKLFERLQMYSFPLDADGKPRRQRVIDEIRNRGHLQICSPLEYRELVCGAGGKYPSLIQKNRRDFGVPQGTPISDLIANFYMIDFDYAVHRWVNGLGGRYFRYSDDLIVIMPVSNNAVGIDAASFIKAELTQHGSRLAIKDEKVAVCSFRVSPEGLRFQHIAGKASRNGLEYLGFRFDGNTVHIKDASLSNAWRKLKRHSYGYAKRWVKQYRLRKDVWLAQSFPSEFLIRKLLQNVSYSQEIGYERWTFLKYISRSNRAFRSYSRTFSSQTR